MALRKRHEHGLGTCAVFIDLVKAFDSVPHNGLLVVLKKFEIPSKLNRLIMKFHSDLAVKDHIIHRLSVLYGCELETWSLTKQHQRWLQLFTAVCGPCAVYLCGMFKSTSSFKSILNADFFLSHSTSIY